ncbi:MAG: M20/M25/M40 family metallo-hydrolase [Victivallales bacterium]|nr:M20/M25/M40 family metallo-hydrolase [Victivallales bacterium]
MSTLNHRESISNAVNASRRDILNFLEQIVNINSYSHNKQGIDEVGTMIRNEMPECFSAETITHETLGDNYIYKNTKAEGLPILLVGHIDTLCPEDPEFNSLRADGEKLIGPGVNDMKGGDTVMIWALKILDQLGLLEDIPITCVFNSDEELGSIFSKDIFIEMEGKAKLALVFECGGLEGTVVTTRKSNARYRLEINGEANHFGNLKIPKVSAVEELANKITEIENLNTEDKSVVANVGKVAGGLAANAVAESAYMEFEVRHWDSNLEKQTIEKVKKIASTPTVKGCSITLQEMAYRPTMEPSVKSMNIFELIVESASELGQEIIEEKRGGLSDGNWLSHVGIPTIDGFGPLGDGDFTKNEFIYKQTLFDRIELMAHLLLKARKL